MTPLQVLQAHYLNKRIVNDVIPVAGIGNLKGAIIRAIEIDAKVYSNASFIRLTVELPNEPIRWVGIFFDQDLEVE